MSYRALYNIAVPSMQLARISDIAVDFVIHGVPLAAHITIQLHPFVEIFLFLHVP